MLSPSGEEDTSDLSDWHPVSKKKGRSEGNNKASKKLSFGTAATLLPTVPKEKRSKASMFTLNNSNSQKHASDIASSPSVGSPNQAKVFPGPSVLQKSGAPSNSAMSGVNSQPQKILPIAVRPNSSAALITQPSWTLDGALPLVACLSLCAVLGPAQEGIMACSIAYTLR